MQDKLPASTALTFDDVLIEPRYSEVVPSDVDLHTDLTERIEMRVPILSSPMDTVTENKMAIALAQEGGLGVIHKNMSVERQTEEVDKVKRSANGIIVDPVTLPPTASVAVARQTMDESNVSGIPITADGKLVGILTRRDLRFLEDNSLPIAKVMTSEPLVTATGTVTLGEAEKILMAKKVEKLLLVDEEYKLTGLITIKDIDMMRRFPQACKDAQGRLRVGAAIGVFDFERAASLIDKDVDFLVVDSAHGHSSNVIETVKQIKAKWDIEIVAGNVATAEGCRDLITAGADAVKVGIGPGSICTTRVISGIGVPQVTAVYNVAQAAKGSKVRVISDGGIRFSGDITKALAAGAHVVMLGGLLAGLDESPGERVLYKGRTFKAYRGMGSLGAMVHGSSERYRQSGEGAGNGKLVPEGVEGRVPYKGPLSPYLYQLVGGLRAGMGYCGTKTIEELRTHARFIQISPASVRENHPHDIAITQEAPNYTAEFTSVEEH
ncbi:IMP dehydrogenase [Bythopirellula polymerisocia]|uniref:Inosine-5'-monophosphate dehydrogenase n=1 Tax=Bythopirellula polymerisocia TaxID=2528003 RepID=A0A5C6CMH6_9BACT|nr:IMP dehydrogenase [Bythopirellula polymerisocia]TWU24531.1 Inosine-5'-monophosphate dehydrogenase [Bythopirellula polymerisocia]